MAHRATPGLQDRQLPEYLWGYETRNREIEQGNLPLLDELQESDWRGLDGYAGELLKG